MASQRIFVDFAADVQRGEVTKVAITAAMTAAGFTNPATHSVVLKFSSVSKTLIGAAVTAPEADISAVEAVLNGVLGAIVGLPVPANLVLNTISAGSLASLSLVVGQQIRIRVANDGVISSVALAVFTSSGFNDTGVSNPGRAFSIVEVRTTGAGYTIPAGDITITDTVKGSLNLLNVGAIVMPADTLGTNSDFYYIGNALEWYLAGQLRNGTPTGLFKTFADAAAGGAK